MSSQIFTNIFYSFEANLTMNGIKVHWAADAEEHNAIVYSILKAKEIKQMVKVSLCLLKNAILMNTLKSVGLK